MWLICFSVINHFHYAGRHFNLFVILLIAFACFFVITYKYVFKTRGE